MKTVSIEFYERQIGKKAKGPIWGINTADKNPKIRVAGEIIVPIARLQGSGNPDLLRVAQTWLPQNLTASIPRKQLMASTDFRKAVAPNTGTITLISGKEAARILAIDGAADEQERLNEVERHISEAGAARTIADSGATITRADGLGTETDDEEGDSISVGAKTDNVAKLAKAGVEEIAPGIKPQFKMFADTLLVKADAKAVSAVKARQKFSKKEIKYLLRVLPKKYTLTREVLTQAIA